MLGRLVQAAALCGLAVLGTGCCGGLTCGDECAGGSPYAFMKYDCACETCGPGFGGSCGDGDCTCGSKVDCGDKCTCGGGCADGCCGAAGRIGPCGDRCDGGCTTCGRRSPCRILNWLCACSGCGEFYWNEWYNDPPRCAEPCDCYGNWIGPGHGGGQYRAPYRSHHDYAAAEAPATSPPPLETADASAATYDDADLDAELR